MNQMAALESKDIAETAFARARKAFAAHRHLSVEARLAELSKLKQVILARRDEICARVMADVGKCRTDALIAEIVGSVDWINWLEANAVKLLKPQKVKTPITLLGKNRSFCISRWARCW